jgi:hypothetical protein
VFSVCSLCSLRLLHSLTTECAEALNINMGFRVFYHGGHRVFSPCSLCVLCVLCGFCIFKPQRAQSFLTTEVAEASSATRGFEFYTTEDTEFFLRVLCVFSVFSAVLYFYPQRAQDSTRKPSLCSLRFSILNDRSSLPRFYIKLIDNPFNAVFQEQYVEVD